MLYFLTYLSLSTKPSIVFICQWRETEFKYCFFLPLACPRFSTHPVKSSNNYKSNINFLSSPTFISNSLFSWHIFSEIMLKYVTTESWENNLVPLYPNREASPPTLLLLYLCLDKIFESERDQIRSLWGFPLSAKGQKDKPYLSQPNLNANTWNCHNSPK